MDIILGRIFWVQIHEPYRGSHMYVLTRRQAYTDFKAKICNIHAEVCYEIKVN